MHELSLLHRLMEVCWSSKVGSMSIPEAYDELVMRSGEDCSYVRKVVKIYEKEMREEIRDIVRELYMELYNE